MMLAMMRATGDPADRAQVAAQRVAGTVVVAPARIVVPVDGSPFAERALPVAAWLAQAIGVPIHLLEVVRPGQAERVMHQLDGLARRYAAASWDATPGDNPAAAIVATTGGERPGLACLATHGRDRSAAVLGSVAAAVLDRSTEPVLLVGPKARPASAADAPIMVAVDGAPDDAAVVGVARDWAVLLGRRLVVATVAEPVPPSFRESRPLHRARGPDDPEGYVAGLAGEVVGTGCPVETRVAYDPLSVRSGLVDLVDRTAAWLVVGSHRRTRPLRALLGSHAARVVHDVEVPALVVPLDAGG
jgi:nucleotide-binding universal stress UspA family protein